MPALERYFDILLAKGGSDLHLSVGHPATIRLKGELVAVEARPLERSTVQQLMDELLDEDQRAHFHAYHDLDFAYGYQDKARFRANYLYKTSGPGAVFRTIPSEILSAVQLSLPAAVVKLADRRAGLILVTGPTGSGKSTTLAGMLDHINRTREAHILTIEDPVEFVHRPRKCQITHREVGVHTPSFADAIRSAGRENADVILVGELRDRETMKLALQLASFGILIFATVHTNSAPATIDRFVNAFPASQQPQIRGMLADSLAGIVAQQLLRKADGSGRVAAQEILIGTPGVASAIRESKTSMLQSLIQGGGSFGMQSIDAVLGRLVAEGAVSASDALDKAADKDNFAKLPQVAAGLKQ
ncbi:MAG: PilT/PilU family type 4a pilus ATPase [Polyangiales bacterium]